MVQTKKPAFPAPSMGSRSSSAQALPTKKKGVKSNAALYPPKLLSNGHGSTTPVPSPLSQPKVASYPLTPPSKSPKKKTKSKKSITPGEKAKALPGSSFARIFPYLLFVLTVYAAAVCPKDLTTSDPVCQAVSAWKAQVMEPYIMPHIVEMRQDPRIRYLENRVIFPTYDAVVMPAYDGVHTVYDTIWSPFYDKTLLPFYDNTLHPKLRPYTTQAHVYVVRLRRAAYPYVKRVWSFYDAVLPYIEEAYARLKTVYAYLEPHVIDIYHAVLPYIQDAYRSLMLLLQDARDKARGLRRVYVDPHVEKMLAKVNERPVKVDAEI
ncbi:hypothetical protein CPB85DRAFT_1306091 [Mucidula mucida]|nr:hypothetical protein CPB85DRAFT_1562234 [Mucidula mucida]KAF8909925.1 hypothetical protein CPB85DRAFT_1306091 [Mucidula mucida]